MKQRLRKLIAYASQLFGATRIGEPVLEAVIQGGMDRAQGVSSRGVSLRFAVPNRINRFRIKSFTTKEPETLDWIDQLPESCQLWDVGANVGLYSVYAAKTRRCKVVAFEPSVFNLELLARNIFLNKLQDRVNIIPLALNEKIEMNIMRMTTTDWGGALSSFGRDFGWDGKNIDPTFLFSTLGVSMDDCISLLQIPKPDFVKMDVDGLEHIILRGGAQVLSGLKGILLEINDDFKAQVEESRRLLESAGLTMKDKLHAPLMENSVFAKVYNQIWVRK